ncbi:MAG: hypothetical protein IIA83_00600 [Thaumarchaeota archaeon]|nr:hypothetical protein [Nitrososphaerota archaeon]
MIEGNEFLAYAKNYERAAKILLREISEYTDIWKIQFDDPKMDDISLKSDEYGLFPILYAVRHYLELQFKGLILANHGEFNKIKTHNLQKLLHLLEETIGKDRISKEVKQYVQKLHDYDFSSEALRYPYDNNGTKIELGSPEKNISNAYADRSILVKILQADFSKVSRELENLEGNLDAEREMKNEMMNEYDSFS